MLLILRNLSQVKMGYLLYWGIPFMRYPRHEGIPFYEISHWQVLGYPILPLDNSKQG